MPDDKGDWLPEEREKILKWFNENTTPKECTFCGTRAWTLGGSAGLLPCLGGRNILLGPTIPVVLVFCSKCAHIEFFSPVLMKLLTDESTTTDASKKVPAETEVASGQ